MDRNVLFICFSGNRVYEGDESVRDIGRRFRQYVERSLRSEDDGLRVFFDETILPSAEWDAEIRNNLAATISACFLLSVDLFRSKYVTDVEAPVLLEGREDGSLAITNLKVGSLSPDQCVIDYTKKDGTPASFDLAKIKGLNGFDAPVLRSDSMDAVLSAAAKSWVEEVRASRRRSETARPRGQRVVTVEVNVLPKTLRVRTKQPAIELEELSRKKFTGSFSEIFPGMSAKPMAAWGDVAKYLGDPSRTPVGLGISLRIETDQPEVFTKDSSFATHDGAPLTKNGWTFSLACPNGPTADEIRLNGASRFVVVSQLGDRTRSQAHYRTIEQVIHQRLGRRVEVFDGAESHSISSILAVHRPAVLYLAAKARLGSGNLVLGSGATEESEAQLLDELKRAKPAERVNILVLALTEIERTHAMRVAHRFASVVPIVILCQAATAAEGLPDAEQPPHIASAFLDKLFSYGHVTDVARTAHEVSEKILIWSSGSAIRADRKASDTPRVFDFDPRLLLDRLPQRGEVKNLIEERLVDGNDRVGAAIAFGTARNHVHYFFEQVRAYLIQHPIEDVPVRCRAIKFDPTRAWDSASLLEQFCEQLGCRSADLRKKLVAFGPDPSDRPGYPSIFVLGAGKRECADAKTSASDVQVFCEFVRTLNDQVESPLRILGLLCIEYPDSAGDKELKRALEKVVARVQVDNRIRPRVISELGLVGYNEIHSFLVDSARVPAKHIPDIADRLYERSSDGRFDDLIEWLHPLRMEHYTDYMIRLGLTPPDPDDDPDPAAVLGMT